MKTVELVIDGHAAKGVEISLPKAPLVLASGSLGFVMCGYLSLDAADRLGVAAAVVRGVNTVEELLNGKVVGVSKAAAERGVSPEMTGRQALSKLL